MEKTILIPKTYPHAGKMDLVLHGQKLEKFFLVSLNHRESIVFGRPKLKLDPCSWLLSILLAINWLQWWLLRSLLGYFPGNTISTLYPCQIGLHPWATRLFLLRRYSYMRKKFLIDRYCHELLSPQLVLYSCFLTSGFNYTSAATINSGCLSPSDQRPCWANWRLFSAPLSTLACSTFC